MRIRKYLIATVSTGLAISLASTSAATADDGASTTDPPQDPVTASALASYSNGEIDAAMSAGDAPGNSVVEDEAVSDYLAELAPEGAYLESEDLDVATLDVGDDMTAVLIAPDDVEVTGTDVLVDAETNEVSAGIDADLAEPDPQTAGPGMGSWPSWADVPSYAVEIRVYWDRVGFANNYIGKARFQTQRRKYSNDGSAARDIWQVGRRATAYPDELENGVLPDDEAYVKKLWISQKLTPGSAEYAQQWRDDLTNPRQGFQQCDDGVGGEINLGPFTFVAGNCADYDVWQGDTGHYRFDYDQGTWSGGNTKAIGYVSGFQMDNGRYPGMTWYQFVTFRIGHTASLEQNTFKCTGTQLGSTTSALEAKCQFN